MVGAQYWGHEMQESSAGDQIMSWAGNSASAGAVVSSLLGWLPPAAALIALIWYVIQIYESDTISKWIRRHRARKIARLRETLAALESKTKAPAHHVHPK